MTTIEERAKAYSATQAIQCYSYCGYIKGATEQDRIARQEERERCIKAVQDAFCNEKQCKQFWVCDSCCDKVIIAINGIKAMEEGGNNDND